MRKIAALFFALVLSAQAFAGYNPANPNGAATSANSAPVVVASDQAPFGVNISNTPTFNLGSLNGAATANYQTAIEGSATGGTAATNSALVGGTYNTTAPTLTNGQQASAQLDSSGRVIVNVGANAGLATSANQPSLNVDGGSLSHVSNFPSGFNVNNIPTFNLGTLNGASTASNQTAIEGSSTGGTAATNSALVGGVYNTSAPALTNGQQASAQLDSSGRLIVNVGANSGLATSANQPGINGDGGALAHVTNFPANPATVISGQKTVSTSASALASNALSNGIVITAPCANAANIGVGPSGVTMTTAYLLVPCTSISYGVTNSNAVYIISAASTTDTVSFTGN